MHLALGSTQWSALLARGTRHFGPFPKVTLAAVILGDSHHMAFDDSDNQDLAFLGCSLEALHPASLVREAYLSRLAELVRKGEYHVDAETLAEHIIRKSTLN